MKSLIKIMVLFFAVSFTSCIEEIRDEKFFEDDELTITGYLERNADDYSMMIELLERAGFKSAFNAFGTYTLFIFDNDAFSNYLSEHGISSVSDLSDAEARLLVRFHAFSSELHSSNMGLGKLPVKNMEDDELVSTFDETGIQGITINREAKVIRRDIELSNGVVHVLDQTLTPLTKSVIQQLDETGGYSIFVEATRQTGFYDILDKIYVDESEDADRVFFTLLAETDAIYQQEGISSFEDLKAMLDNGINDHTHPDDSLNKFVANHIIPNKVFFTKDLEQGNYQSYYGELINMVIDTEFKINLQTTDEDETWVGFLDNQVDFPAKNGVVHSIDKVLHIFFPEPVEVLWEFNDQPVFRDLVRVSGQNSDTYTNFDLFPNMWGTATAGFFAHYPWTCYGFVNCRAMVFNGPGWDVTAKMPIRVVQGRYRLYLNYKDGSGRATIQVLVNGIPIGEPINMAGPSWYSVEKFVGEINLPETKENEIRIVTVVNGVGQLDYVRFEPI